MGEKNSSKTRVVPVFDRIADFSATTTDWLSRLLRLTGTELLSGSLAQGPIGARLWGDSEKKLDPPVSLLSYLIRTMPSLVGFDDAEPDDTRLKRKLLSEGDSETIRLALRELRNGYKKKDWFVLEGQTQPDVFYESDDIIFVVEGKRTEAEATENTKWMAGRHQMLRHIDCAWEVRGRKRVLGMLIVEGAGDDQTVPAYWQDYSDRLASAEVMASSLPHRGPDEQRAISECFVGVTTWQQVCHEFDIPWPLPG